MMGNFDDGDIVLVHDFDGYPLGRGFINRHSKIRVRMLTRNIDQEINEAFLREKASGRMGISEEDCGYFKLPYCVR